MPYIKIDRIFRPSNHLNQLVMNSISLDQLRSQMPQAFVEAPHSRVSSKYSFIPTHQILGDLDKLGWKIREVQNPRYKSQGNQLHGKHLIRLFNPNIHISKGADKNYVEIALYNSSNGQSKFRMEVGVFRAICENGLVIKSHDFGSVNIRHAGYSFEALKESIDKMVERLPEVVTKINTFSARTLSQEEMQALAEKAYELRNSGRKATPEEVQSLLQVRREGDQGNSLWIIMNRLQEGIVRGGTLLVDKRGRMKVAKPIQNLDKGLKLNTGIWELAEQFC